MVSVKAKLGLWLLLWSCTTTSVYAVSQEDLDYGLKIFFRAYEASSWFEGKKDPSIEPFSRWISTSGRESIEEQLKGYPADTKVESYKSWFFNDNGAFPRHPEDYKKECSKFAQNPFGKPSVDESQCLKDDGKDYPFKALSHCIINQMRKRGGDKIIETWLQRDAPSTSNAAVSQEDLDYGLKIFFRALEATSWFEGEHDSSILPNYRYISNTAKNNIKEQLKPYPVQTQIQSYQAWFFNDYGPYAKHPEEYKKECSKFAEEPFEKPTVDESKILEDAGRDYPFKALSHCIMNLMRKRGGDNIFEKWLKKDSETYSASAVVVSQEDLDYGLKMFFRALNVTTWFEGKQDSSIYSHYEWASTLALQSYEEQMKKFPVQFKLETYQTWLINEHGPLAKHPEEYRKECSKFAQDAFVKPIEDESKILEDERKQYPFQALSYCLLSLMRKREDQQKADQAKQISATTATTTNLIAENESTEPKISEEDLDYAFEMFFRAYEATCLYEGGLRNPFPHDADIYQHCKWAIVNFKNMYLKPQPMKVKLEHHQSWFFREHGPFEQHPNEYKKECSKFAEDVFANPTTDESQTLEDEGKVYPFKALSYCLINQMRKRGGDKIMETGFGQTETSVPAVSQEDLDYGVKMFFRAYEASCWYEGGYKYPLAQDIHIYSDYRQILMYYKNTTLDYLKSVSVDKQLEWYQSWFFNEHGPFPKFPDTYKKECSKFAEDAFAKPTVDESQTLEDEGKEYPFRALTYCIMNQMRQHGGYQIIDTWKNDRFHNKKDWRQAALERHNVLRAAHGSPPLIMTDELHEGAQEWSEKLAQECAFLYHTPRKVLYDKGENLALPLLMDDPYMEGLFGTNGFYEEVKDYCYPHMFVNTRLSDPPGCEMEGPRQTGHFTQMIWKNTKKIGLGLACNPKCFGNGRCYVTARYWPSGNFLNWPNSFKENVQRPTY